MKETNATGHFYSLSMYVLVGLLLVAAWGVAHALRPTKVVKLNSVDLEREIPTQFGQWREIKTGIVPVAITDEDRASVFWPYDQLLSRVYRRVDGQIVMLSLAWGSKQRQDIKVHWPEVCYPAQGYRVQARSMGSI